MIDAEIRKADRDGDARRAVSLRERCGMGWALDVWARDAGWSFLTTPRGLLRYEIAAMRRHKIGTPSLYCVTLQ